MAQEIDNYYLKHNCSVYCVLLDASQAFDHVRYVKLFKVLLKRNICLLVARLLAFIYRHYKLRVKYSSVIIESFDVRNGVKRGGGGGGGILSPILFALYVDVLFIRLQHQTLAAILGMFSLEYWGMQMIFY